MECRVEFDYEAQEPDELTIKKGDIIKNVVTKMDGWFEGTLRGKKGVFPDNFVKIVEKPSSEPKADNFVKISEKPSSETKVGKGSDGVVLRNNPSSSRRVKVLFSYAPEQDDELALEVGDVLDFIEEVEEGWWRGKLRGKEGIFPSNFVQEIEEHKTNGNTDPSSNKPDESRQRDSSRNSHTKAIPDVVPTSPTNQSIDDDPSPPELPPKPVRELARCFYPYTASNEDELTLVEGDIITIISKKCEDEGWWRGELRGRIGLFPDNFVKILTPGEVITGGTKINSQQKILAQERNVPQGVGQYENSKAKRDSISGAGGTVVDGVGISKTIKEEKGDHVNSSKIEQAKAKLSKTNSKESPAPIAPKVGHPATSPISPNIAALHSNLFSNQIPPDAFARKDFSPLIVKDEKASDESEEFNSVERTETLNHLTANRAKAPKRRPPSTIITREADGSLVNGSSHSYENSMSDSPPPHQSTPVNLSVTSNGVSSGSFTDGGSLNTSGSFLSQSRDKESSPTPSSGNSSMTASKAKKQTPPWMAELKQTQDKKRGLVSPVASPATTVSVSSSAVASPPVTTTPAQVLPTVPPKDTQTKAPPLPAKPSSFTGTEKPVNNMNHSSSNNSPYSVSNKNFSKKSPSPAPPVPVTSAINNSQLTENHRGEGDANSNKVYVNYDEYMALKLRVTSLENEVETLKRQIKMLIDRDLRGHIV